MRGTLLFTQEDNVFRDPGTIHGFKLTWDSSTSGYGIAVYRYTATGGVETFWQECPTMTDVTNFLSTYNISLSTRIRNVLSNKG